MKKLIFIIATLALCGSIQAQNLKGYKVTAVDTLRAEKVFKFGTGYVPAGTEEKGSSYWDEANKTVSTVVGDGVIYQWGQEAFVIGQNNTGAPILNGTPVMYAGSIGNSGNFRMSKAYASKDIPVFMFVGLVTHDVINGAVGKITTRGKIRGIQTDGANYGQTWTDGQIIYLGATAGTLTNVEPQAPVPAIPVALVISAHATMGTLEVRPTFPNKLSELTDVNGTLLNTKGQFPVWDNSRQVFDFNYKLWGVTDGLIQDEDYNASWLGKDSVTASKDAIYKKIKTLESADYCPVSATVNRGTLISGTVSNLCAKDGSSMTIQEINGPDPLRITFNFTGIEKMNYFLFFGQYAGGAGHLLDAEIYNPVTLTWDYLGTFGLDATPQWHTFPIHLPDTYISAGAVQTRISHEGNGVSSHQLILDYVDINFGGGGGGTAITASEVSFSPTGNISAANVQAAIQELDSEKQPLLNGTGYVKAAGTTISYDQNVVTNASTSTDNAVARFDATTGKIIQNSKIIIDDYGRISQNDEDYNIFIGNESGTSRTTGTNNVGIGRRSLNFLENGSYNTAIGSSALSRMTSGAVNTGIGVALDELTTGSYNFAAGSQALGEVMDGTYNIGIGHDAGNYANGFEANTTPDNSIYIGKTTKSLAQNSQNEIVIGADAIGHGSNTVRLGNTSITGIFTSGKIQHADAVNTNESATLGQLNSAITALNIANYKLKSDSTATDGYVRRDRLTSSLATKENAFTKNTAFNKNFGTTAGTVLEGRTFGTAAASNTGDFVQNQNVSAQTANMWINGTGTIGTQLLVGVTLPTAFEANIVAPQIATTSNAEELYQVANYGQVQGMINAIAGNYIQNQNASAQTANMWISGEAKINSNLLVGGATARGFEREIQVKGGANHAAIGLTVDSQSADIITNTSNVFLFYDRTNDRNLLQLGGSGNATFSGNVTAPSFIATRYDGGTGLDVNGGDLGPGSNIAAFRDYNNAYVASIDGQGSINAKRLISYVATGTAPLTIASTTLVTNLNADLLDGQHGSYYQPLLTNPVTGTGTANYIPKWGVGGTSLTGTSNIYDNGTNVGIGTTAPSRKLTVEGSATIGTLGDGNLNWMPAVGNNQLFLTSTTSAAVNTGSVLSLGGRYRASDNGQIAYASIAGLNETGINYLNGYLALFTSNHTAGGSFERMRITSTGNVGIGTISPYGTATKALTISDFAVAGNRTAVEIMGSGGTADVLTGELTFYQRFSGANYFGSRIGNIRGNSGVASGTDGGTSSMVFYSKRNSATAETETMRLSHLGSLLINTTTDNTVDKLQVNGSILGTTAKLTGLTDGFIPYHSSDAVGLINSPLSVSGSAVTSTGTITATNFILSSDKRLKTGIRPATDLNWVDDIRFKEFYFKAGNGKLRYGVIAQEVEKINENLVNENEDGMKGVSYIDLLIAKVARQDEIINELIKKIENLEKNEK